MTPKSFSKRNLLVSFIVSVLLLSIIALTFFSPTIESAKETSESNRIDNYDIRLDESAKGTIDSFMSESDKTDAAISDLRKSAKQAENNLNKTFSNLDIEFNNDLRIPEIIGRKNIKKKEFLTAPSNKQRAEILRSFLIENQQLFGLNSSQINSLKTKGDYANPNGILSFVAFEQTFNQIPVFRGEVKAGFTKDNQIFRIINNLAPNTEQENLSIDFGSPENAVLKASKHININLSSSDVKKIESVSGDDKVTFESKVFTDNTTAEKIYFPIDVGVARAAWRVLFWTKNAAYYVIVDAQSGKLLWRKNITEYQTETSTYNVYGNQTSPMKTADSPSPSTPGCISPNNCPNPLIIPRINFTMVGNEPPFDFNNLGWIPDSENRTIGNNVEVGIDRDGTQGIDPNGWAFGNPNRVFSYTYNPAPGNPAPGEEPIPTTQTYPPSQFQQGSITQAFYSVNRWHDETYLLGFTEASRNFQINNFGRGGSANDSILVEVQDGSGTNGANFSTPADGGRPIAQFFVFTAPDPDHDGALDNQVVVHELTHGLSNRLHGNTSGLGSNMSRGMGEGWGDFYALALLSEPTDAPCGVYSVGGYVTEEIITGIANYYYGIRRFPTSRISCTGSNGNPYNPLTFADLNAGCDISDGEFPRGPIGSSTCDQVHNAGEIWSQALWEVRGGLIEDHGAVEGNRRVLQYVTDGMKISPLNPTFLQSRDAIISAANASDPNDVNSVMRGFALRGMGISAQILSTNPANVVEAFDAPVNTTQNKVRADFDGDGRSDISVYRPSEGNWYLNQSVSGFSVIKWGISSDALVPADYDGDGKTDYAVFRANADSDQPDFYILNSSDFTFDGYSWGLPDDVPVIDDFDGDGKADISIYRPSQNIFYVLQSTLGVYISSRMPDGIPMSGDFDGDGKADFVSYNSGQWFITESVNNHQTNQNHSFGLATDRLVPADYDGDGRADVAVYRPSNGIWYIQRSSGGYDFIQFGISTDIPTPGDYDGDGNADVAVYRDGVWYINRSTAGIYIIQFGIATDKPIPKQYLPQ